MKKRIKCYLSYSSVDSDFVFREILPVLKSLNLNFQMDLAHVRPGMFFADEILSAIRKSDIVLVVLKTHSEFVNLELGVALGQDKPIIGIGREKDTNRMGLNFLSFKDQNSFHSQLENAIEVMSKNVIEKSMFDSQYGVKILGIKSGIKSNDFEKDLRFTADLLSLIKEITGKNELTLLESGKGSFKSFISLDLKSWAELLEKILFFIPEWKKRKADYLLVEAETQRIRAETGKIKVETDIAKEKMKIEQADAMADLLIKYKDLGVQIQIDDDLLITLSQNGHLEIIKPPQLE